MWGLSGDGWRINPLIISIVLNSPCAFVVVVSSDKDLFIVVLLVPSGGTHLLNLRKKEKSEAALSCPPSLSCMSRICQKQSFLLCLFAQPRQSSL